MKSRWYVIISEEMYGAEASEIIYLPPMRDVNYGKCLKKVWKHYWKMYEKMPNVSVWAIIESEDGECHDMSQFWIYEELGCMEEAGVLPEEVPFI